MNFLIVYVVQKLVHQLLNTVTILPVDILRRSGVVALQCCKAYMNQHELGYSLFFLML